jgi:acyl carrier protein
MSDRNGSHHAETGHADPVDPAEVIADSWRAVLGVPAVVAEDDFFELGGDSLMVNRIVSYLRRELAIEVDVLQVWETPVFGEFRDAVTAQMSQEAR